MNGHLWKTKRVQQVIIEAPIEASIGLDKQKLTLKFEMFSYTSVLTYVLGAQKNRLIETVLLSTHSLCFDLEIRKICYALFTKGLFDLNVFIANIIQRGRVTRFFQH